MLTTAATWIQAAIYGDSLEFYHDKGGLMTSKQGILMRQKKHLWQSNQRTGKGSIEVYSIKDYGAVEIGLHKFHNNQEPAGTPSEASKFIIMWQHKNTEWRITKVISCINNKKKAAFKDNSLFISINLLFIQA
jgi:hypothetical protein